MIGAKLGNRFEIVRELGKGGMGVVYLARDPYLDRDVAIKLVSPHLSTPEALERFNREAKVVARMDHPGIVAVHDIGQHEGSLYFVMPYVPGVSLRSLIASRSLNLGDLLEIAAQVADALEYSHAMNVIHRDIKPENILVMRQEETPLRARVTDFGLARAAADHQSSAGDTFAGTIAYLSPEQVAPGEVDGRSDMYSLAVVLYEALAGHPPFTGDVHTVLFRIASEVPRSLRDLGVAVDPELDAFTLRCLEKDPALRPQKARHMAEMLRHFGLSLHQKDRDRVLHAAPENGLAPLRPLVPEFVGREKELGELQHRLSMALTGECQFAVIAGEAGAGKSRLLDELEQFARTREIRVLHGRFVEQEAALPYQAFGEMIQAYLHRTPSTRSSSPANFTDLAHDLIALFPVLAEELSLARTSPSEVDARIHDRTYIFDLLARSFLRIGGGKPMVLQMEDLQYGDVSLEALQYIVRRLGPAPVLIAATYRSTEVDKRHPLTRMLNSFQGDKRFAHIELGPFTKTEHRAFLKSILGSESLAKDFVRKIYESTEGNAHFTCELIRSLMDSGHIRKHDTGTWTLSGEGILSSDLLPPTIQQAVEKRIERLPEEWVEVLSLASILGRTFDLQDLESLAGELETEMWIDRLIEAGFLEEERGTRSDHLIFSSRVVREVLYARVPRRRRRLLHRKHAEMLESRYAGRLERIYPQLVHHFAEGDVAEKVVQYGMSFARRSLESFSAEEALRAGKAVLEFLQEEGASAELGELRLILAESNRLYNYFDEALKEAESAIRTFEQIGDVDRVIQSVVISAEISWQARRVEAARRFLEKGLGLAREDIQSRIRLLSLGATMCNLRGEYELAAEYTRELQRIRPAVAVVEPDLPRGGTLVVPLAIPVQQGHPASSRTSEEMEVIGNVYQNLLRTDEQGLLVPELCSSWKESGKGRTFTFTLRDEVHVHDGRKLTASLVKHALEQSIGAASKRLGPAFSVIHGLREFLDGDEDNVEGIQAVSDQELVIQLSEPLPIYPVLLTDPAAAISLDSFGTGPFRIETFHPERVRLVRNEHYWRTPPLLDAIEFHCGVGSAEAAAGFRSGKFDVAGNLPPRDLEKTLQDHRLKAGMAETVRKSTYFVAFHEQGPIASIAKVRQAMSGVIRPDDLVRATLGRLAQPAEGLVPPGILGHDPGRLRQVLTQEQAIQLLKETGLKPPIRMKASVHSALQDRYEVFLRALFRVWADLGIEVSIQTSSMQQYLDSQIHNEELDMIIGRWLADYNDPDDFFSHLFRAPAGIVSHFFSDDDTDAQIDRARFTTDPREREKMYHSIEDQIGQTACFVTLFHEMDYRVFHQNIRKVKLENWPPFVNYFEIAKAEAAVRKSASGVVVVPMAGDVPTLDPAHMITAWQAEVGPVIFENLLRTGEGANIIPWLASEFQSENGGRSYRLRLRDDVRFHDGRRLTARDVRYSFQKLLASGNPVTNWLLTPIEGASEILNGHTQDLSGFHLISPLEFRIDLVQPISIFPALLTSTPASIIPEGSRKFDASWREGCIGTGPFRVARFEPGTRIELEANPHYWREGVPHTEGVHFILRVPPAEMLTGLQAGRFSLAGDLVPADAEVLRHEPEFASGYHATPSLSTYLLVFNIKQGPLANVALRQRIVNGLDVEILVRHQAGRLAIPASGLIPPGLLGYEPALDRTRDSGSHRTRSTERIELRCIIHSIYDAAYQPLAQRLFENLRNLGFHCTIIERRSEYASIPHFAEIADLNLTRWIADYSDADAFAYSMVHSEKGLHGPFCGIPELDRLAEQGRVETDPAVRHELYREFEKIIARNFLMLPLFHEQTYRIVRRELEGFEFHHNFPTVNYEHLRRRS